MKSQILLRLFLCISLIPPLFAVTAQSAECTSFDLQVKVADTTAIVQLQKLHPEVRFTRIFPYSPKYEQRHRAHGLHLWYKAEINDSVTAKRIQRNLAKRKDVSHISRTVYVCNTISDSTSVLTSHKQGSQESSDQYCVNDPLYPRQWHYTNHYYPQSVDINLEKAWTLEQGSRNVIVAVMDHTIDVTHEDLRDNIWVNEAELNGEPGVDDDGDGYVDDVYGYDYAQLKGYSRQPADHGTHVAGTIVSSQQQRHRCGRYRRRRW